MANTFALIRSGAVGFITTIHQTDDLFDVFLRSSSDLPVPKQTENLKRLATFVRNILLAEAAILRQLARSEKEQDKSRVSKEIEKHNSSAARNMWLIDREVFRILGADPEEIREVYRVLGQLGLYDYGVSAELDSFIKELEIPLRVIPMRRAEVAPCHSNLIGRFLPIRRWMFGVERWTFSSVTTSAVRSS